MQNQCKCRGRGRRKSGINFPHFGDPQAFPATTDNLSLKVAKSNTAPSISTVPDGLNNWANAINLFFFVVNVGFF